MDEEAGIHASRSELSGYVQNDETQFKLTSGKFVGRNAGYRSEQVLFLERGPAAAVLDEGVQSCDRILVLPGRHPVND